MGAGDCNKSLPVNMIERQISFGRFLTLSATSIPPLKAVSGTMRDVVLPLHFINPIVAASSRGALINTISLGPQEETTIELFTWERHTSASEQTSSSEVEQNIESTVNIKDTTQVANELTKDSNFKADAHVHANVNVSAVNIGGDAGVNYGNDAKNVARSTTDYIHESTQKATLRVKASRQNKVSESEEYGSEQRTTRKLKNPNMCHALNLDYFEVLVNYKVQTVCDRQDAQLVVLLDFPETFEWTRRNIRRFEPLLKSVLLDRSYIAGFDASRLLAARD